MDKLALRWTAKENLTTKLKTVIRVGIKGIEVVAIRKGCEMGRKTHKQLLRHIQLFHFLALS